MKTLIAFSTSTLLLTACSSSVLEQQDDPIVENLMGKPAAYAEKKLGLPNKRRENKSGSMVWVYVDNSKGMAAKHCSVTLSIRNDVIENVVIDTEQQSLLSLVSSSCQRIRDSLTRES